MVEVESRQEIIDGLTINAIPKPIVVAGIPALNEEKTIAGVVLEAQKCVDIVVVCDDGSDDLTGEIAEKMGAVVVRHNKNLGYGAAMQSLFKQARTLNADVLVTLDSDGQHNPEQIPKLLKPITDGTAEVVLGSRFLDKNGTQEMPLYRQLGVKVITKMANGSGKNAVSDAQSGFRAYSKFALERLSMYENGMSASVELLREIQKSGLTVHEVPISCKYSKSVGAKTSTKNPLSHGLGLIISLIKIVVEDRPLPFLGIPGILSILVGTAFGFWTLDLYANSGSIVTNVALTSIFFVLIGFFMISTAITLYAISRLAKRAGFNDNHTRQYPL